MNPFAGDAVHMTVMHDGKVILHRPIDSDKWVEGMPSALLEEVVGRRPVITLHHSLPQLTPPVMHNLDLDFWGRFQPIC